MAGFRLDGSVNSGTANEGFGYLSRRASSVSGFEGLSHRDSSGADVIGWSVKGGVGENILVLEI